LYSWISIALKKERKKERNRKLEKYPAFLEWSNVPDLVQGVSQGCMSRSFHQLSCQTYQT